MAGTSEVEYFDKYGKPCEEKEAMAYKTDKSFFLQEYMGAILAKDMVVLSRNKSRLKYVRVGPISFGYYLNYLKTGLKSWYSMSTRNRGD